MLAFTNLLYTMAFFAASVVICAQAQYYAQPNMGGAVGCVVTVRHLCSSSKIESKYNKYKCFTGKLISTDIGHKLFSHGNYIRDLNSEELRELIEYKKELLDFKKKVDVAYANMDILLHKNGTLPIIPARPIMPAFCASNETTLYILGGCLVQNHKIYIGGKYARDLNEKEKMQLDEFARQMVAANFSAAQAATAQNPPLNTMNSTISDLSNSTPGMSPPTTTVSPISDAGRQIALDFCTEF